MIVADMVATHAPGAAVAIATAVALRHGSVAAHRRSRVVAGLPTTQLPRGTRAATATDKPDQDQSARAAGLLRGVEAQSATTLKTVRATFAATDNAGCAAELFAVARAETTGAVAAFTVRRAGSTRIAAIAAANLGRVTGTDARRAVPSLPSWTGHRLRRGGGTARRLCAIVQHCAPNRGRSPESQQPLQHRASAGPRCQRLGKRIEAATFH